MNKSELFLKLNALNSQEKDLLLTLAFKLFEEQETAEAELFFRGVENIVKFWEND